MAKVVNVVDVPEMPGAGMLHFDDGRPPLMALPEIANDYRAHLGIDPIENGVAGPGTGTPDLAKQDRDQFVSDVSGAARKIGSFFTTPVGGGFVGPGAHPQAAPTPAPPPPQAAPAPQQAAPTPQGDGVPPMLARPPDPAPQQAAPGQAAPQPGAPPSTDDLVSQANDAERRKAADELINGKVVPGGAGRPGGYQPNKQKVTTEAGPAYDTGMAGMRIDADRQLLDAQLAQANATKVTADAQAARAAAALPVYQQQAAKAQDDVARKEQAYQAQRQHLENELQSYSESAKPDPNKFFAQRGTVGNIMSVLGQALGAIGASLGHSQNFAFEYAQNQIKNDIESQRAAYEGGRADRNNALARFANYYHGDMDMAQNALTIAMNKVVATEATQFSSQSQSQQATAAANVLAAQFAKDSLTREQQLYNASIGKTTTETEDKYQTPQAASGPGRKKLTDAEEAHRLKILKAGGTPALSATGEARQKANYGTKIEATERFTDALAHEAELSGVRLDPETGTIVDPKTGKPATDLNVPVGAGYVGQHLPNLITPKDATALQRARVNSARLHSSAVLGKDLSAEEGQKEADRTLGQTDSERLDSLRQRAHELYRLRRSQDATAASIDPSIVNARNQAQKDVNVSRATGQPLPAGPRGAAEGDSPEPESDSP